MVEGFELKDINNRVPTNKEINIALNILKLKQLPTSPGQLRKAYLKRSIKIHPDKNKDNLEFSKLKFQQISMANDVLKKYLFNL